MNKKMKIKKPALLIDEKKCKNNIDEMISKAVNNNLIFRPHFKTHQSYNVGRWFRDKGVDKITVSSVSMAEYFIKDGWNDITIAFPFNILEIDNLNNISADIVVNILIESPEVFEVLRKKLKRKVNYFIKIDAGYNRTGLEIGQTEEIIEIAKSGKNTKFMEFRGLLSHFGQSYNAKSKKDIEKYYIDAVGSIKQIREKLIHVCDDFIVSIGDTPVCSTIDVFDGIDEIRPGNFVYYDVMQYFIGSCDFCQIAVTLACPVVAKHKSRDEIVIYGGAVHLSKDFVCFDNKKYFGLIVELNDDCRWNDFVPGTYLKSVSQEHGIIATDKSFFDKIKVGDIIGVVPVHSCLTANLSKENIIIVK